MNAQKNTPTNNLQSLLMYIDSGEFFRKPLTLLYMVLSALNAIIPFYAAYKIMNSGVLRFGGAKVIFSIAILWVWLLLACWVGAQIWWNRRSSVIKNVCEGSQFFVTPLFSHFIQTAGENFGIFIAVMGFGTSLIGSAFIDYRIMMLGDLFGFPFHLGMLGIIVFPVIGYMLILISRFAAEQIRVFASIANNTQK